MESQDSKTPALIQALQKEVLEFYRKEFDQLSTIFRDLDSKAQGTITISGFALSALLAFVARSKAFEGDLGILIWVVVGALVLAAICSVLALRVRRIQVAPSGDEVRSLVNDLRKVDESELPLRSAFFYGDVARLWVPCIDGHRKKNEVKGRYVWAAQLFLLLALLAMSIMLMLATAVWR
jgi:hypothetical protein